MSILITGGTGFIGVSLTHKLVERGESVVLFDIAPRSERVTDIKGNVRVIQGDLKVWPEVMNVVRDNNVEGIFHLGSMLSLPSEANPWASFQANVAGTMYVLEAARLFEVKRLVFASTVATYGLGTGEVITDETLQRPITMYGVGKLYGELLGRFYRRKFGLDFRALRYCAVMGPGVKNMAVTQYNAWMVENAALGRPYECFVTEDTAIPVTYFKDAIRAIEMLYYAPRENIKTVCYNISGVSPAQSAKQLEIAIRKFIPDAKITYKPDPITMEFFRSQNMRVFDDSRAGEEWDWKPLYTDFEKVVADFIQEVRTKSKFYGLV
ncbi:NAD-dependent epimerase/dehydratase family protein [Chloroflexota bacterium]